MAGTAISYVNSLGTVKELSDSMASALPVDLGLPAALERQRLGMARNHAQFQNQRVERIQEMWVRWAGSKVSRSDPGSIPSLQWILTIKKPRN